MGLESPEGQVLVKIQFVTKARVDFRKKLEKLDDWQEKGLNELLREGQKVYLRREEEKAKTKAKIMVAVARECIGTGKTELAGARKNELRDTARSEPQRQVEEKREPDRGRKTSGMAGMDLACYYCNERGHIKRFCKKKKTKREWDEAIEKESDALGKILKG